MISALTTPLVSSAAMRAIFEDRARLQRMLEFEAALARAQAALGVIPTLATDKIVQAARPERYDLARLAEDAAWTGDIGITLVNALAAEVAKADPEAASYVHWGAAGKDLIDTTLMVELRLAIDALLVDLDRAIDAFTSLAGRHRRTATVGRAGLQHTLPMPFGLKVAGYAAALARARERLRRLRKEALALQLGGPAGTLASLGERGIEVMQRLAALIDLPVPEAPWPGHSDRFAEIAAAFAILTGTCGKIGRDVALLMQTEVAEAFEPGQPGDRTPRGASVAQRERPPAAAATAVCAATLAPNLLATIVAAQVQEHEAAVGSWQAQWHALPALSFVVSGALAAIADVAQGLEVDAERMRSNIENTQGLIMAEAVWMALSAKVPREAARKIVEEGSRKAVAEQRHLSAVLAEDPRVTAHLSSGELARVFELMSYQGVAQTLIERTVGALQARGIKRP
jgi:3-carboxy-cis,cis-muconate cycloisomerase